MGASYRLRPEDVCVCALLAKRAAHWVAKEKKPKDVFELKVRKSEIVLTAIPADHGLLFLLWRWILAAEAGNGFIRPSVLRTAAHFLSRARHGDTGAIAISSDSQMDLFSEGLKPQGQRAPWAAPESVQVFRDFSRPEFFTDCFADGVAGSLEWRTWGTATRTPAKSKIERC